MNFFIWLREGVKRSVMHGFADAVEEIGLPEDEDSGQKLLERLRGGTTALSVSNGGGGKSVNSSQGKPKRLGRSLSQLRPGAEGAA